MFEDKWLLWKLRQGSSAALCRIYEKYKNDLLALAIALSNNKTSAEDIVHDCFVSFAQSANKLQLRDSLKSYLSTSVANRVRNLGRDKIRPVGNYWRVPRNLKKHNLWCLFVLKAGLKKIGLFFGFWDKDRKLKNF